MGSLCSSDSGSTSTVVVAPGKPASKNPKAPYTPKAKPISEKKKPLTLYGNYFDSDSRTLIICLGLCGI